MSLKYCKPTTLLHSELAFSKYSQHKDTLSNGNLAYSSLSYTHTPTSTQNVLMKQHS